MNNPLHSETDTAYAATSEVFQTNENRKLSLSPHILANIDENKHFQFSWKEFVDSNFYISGGWSLDYYTTVRGAENFHIYLWIAKDIAWTQDLYYPAMIFGSLALAWCLVLLGFAVRAGGVLEVYMWIPMVMWLAANFLWMSGEVFNGDDDYVVPRTAYIMEAAISWILLYHVILRPFNLIPEDKVDSTVYARPGLVPRFSYFRDWREYEHAHTLCWLGKDLSWNQLYQPFWVICVIPTLLIATDFIWCTFKTKRMMEDCIHYIAQLMWVVGNMLWAIGNVFIEADDGDDAAFPVFEISRPAKARLRWWGSWVLFAAYWPIIILYLIWIPKTIMGKFPMTCRETMTEIVRSSKKEGNPGVEINGSFSQKA